MGDLGLIPGLGRSSGEGKGYPLPYSGLENSLDSPWDHKESDTSVQLTFLSFSVPTKCQVLEEMIVKATDLTNFQFDWEK